MRASPNFAQKNSYSRFFPKYQDRARRNRLTDFGFPTWKGLRRPAHCLQSHETEGTLDVDADVSLGISKTSVLNTISFPTRFTIVDPDIPMLNMT